MDDLPEGLYKIKSVRLNEYAENWPDDDSGVGVGNNFPERKRNMWRITRNSSDGTYIITSADDSSNLTFIDGEPWTLLTDRTNTGTAWKIENYGTYVSFYPAGPRFRSLRVNTFHHDESDYLCLLPNNPISWGQRWEFQRVEESGTPWTPSMPWTTVDDDFGSKYFPLSLEQAKAQGPYDIIVVGTGIGGGVLARELYEINVALGERAQKILVIERGALIFQTHCLNLARPDGFDKDRAQQNDAFFTEFRGKYAFSEETNKEDWKGGPVYCLGGRSAVWGLFSPRIHKETLKEFFPDPVTQDLLKDYYPKAETLMSVTFPQAKPVHQNLMERLNDPSDLNLELRWKWGRIASNFCQSENFAFPTGAYSTIDKLLAIAMNKRTGADAPCTKFEMILGAEARKLTWTDDLIPAVKGVVVRTATGDECEIGVTCGSGKVVLCAGSVASPIILLRSGLDLTDPSMGGCHLTDHDIISHVKSFRYTDPALEEDSGSMKLQTHVDLGSGNVVLANMSIDASSFLPRGPVQSSDLRKFVMVFIMRAPLNPQNTIKLVNDEPQVTINRSPYTKEKIDLGKLKAVTESAMEAIKEELKIQFVDQPDDKNGFRYLELGGVAHELGTLPMSMGNDPPKPYCVDSNLKLRNRQGVYVCDLSIFPCSPEVNPTLTLAALALRLSCHLLAYGSGARASPRL